MGFLYAVVLNRGKQCCCYNGADDGVEFSVEQFLLNLYLENNDDDSIDWTEGWPGTVDNAYISHTNPGFSTAFEGDKDNNNPKFNNITAVSTVEEPLYNLRSNLEEL